MFFVLIKCFYSSITVLNKSTYCSSNHFPCYANAESEHPLCILQCWKCSLSAFPIFIFLRLLYLCIILANFALFLLSAFCNQKSVHFPSFATTKVNTFRVTRCGKLLLSAFQMWKVNAFLRISPQSHVQILNKFGGGGFKASGSLIYEKNENLMLQSFWHLTRKVDT